MGIRTEGDKMITLRASSIRSFHETPSIWYKNHILGEDKFEGNTATFLGTIVHKYAETFYSLQPFNVDEILETAPEDVNIDEIMIEYPKMCKVLQTKYLEKQAKPQLMEHFMELKLSEDIKLQGTCDAFLNNTLVDYKTASKASKDIAPYSQQLNIYAYLLSLSDYRVDTLRIVQIVRSTKTMAPRINILETKADISEGKRLVTLMHNKTKLALDNPQFKDIIFHDNKYSFLSDGWGIETKFEEL